MALMRSSWPLRLSITEQRSLSLSELPEISCPGPARSSSMMLLSLCPTPPTRSGWTSNSGNRGPVMTWTSSINSSKSWSGTLLPSLIPRCAMQPKHTLSQWRRDAVPTRQSISSTCWALTVQKKTGFPSKSTGRIAKNTFSTASCGKRKANRVMTSSRKLSTTVPWMYSSPPSW
ncbi:hypothetical protein H648_37077gpHYPp2 [Human adenovirus B1]